VFRLALALGLPVRELLARIGSDELTEWMAFYQLEPFGDFRADLRSAIVASTLANAHRSKEGKPFTPEDFMPFVDKQHKELRSDQPKASELDASRLNIERFKAMFAHRIKSPDQNIRHPYG
jgi:hypothetical protein